MRVHAFFASLKNCSSILGHYRWSRRREGIASSLWQQNYSCHVIQLTSAGNTERHNRPADANFLLEDRMTEITQLSPRKADAIQHARPDVSVPRYVQDASSLQSKEDAISFRRWRRGFFLFYGMLALMLSGLAMVASDQSATFAKRTPSTNPSMASADIVRHR
jgi:hypothetical protein